MAVLWDVQRCSSVHNNRLVALVMETACTFYQTKQRNNAEESNHLVFARFQLQGINKKLRIYTANLTLKISIKNLLYNILKLSRRTDAQESPRKISHHVYNHVIESTTMTLSVM